MIPKDCFNVIETKEPTGKGKLDNIQVSVKDCICVKGMQSAGGSAILQGYKPLFNATVINKILEQGATIIGKTTQDEFGYGSFNTNVPDCFPIPKNPHDKERVCGGSSGGSAAATAQIDNHIALAESTGGSIVCPAAFCNVVGLCPTYGRVSRYGLLDYANSLDKIGPMAKSVKECATMLSIIAGNDELDSTSSKEPVEDYESYCGKDIKGMKVGVIKESLGEGVSQEVKDAFQDQIKLLKEKGAVVEVVSTPLTKKYGVATYYIIALSETSTNLAKYCGIRYGQDLPLKDTFNEYFSQVRSKFLGDEAKRRIMLGTFARMSGYRDAYYMKAAKIRTQIINEYKDLFKTYDVLISPTMPVVPPKFEEVKKLTPLENYMMDILTVGPNLAGLPHISIPMGQGLPKGLLIIADHFKEGKTLQVAHELYN